MNFEALFLGPKAENRYWLRHMLEELLNEHVYWRRNFHPEDGASITSKDQAKPDFLSTRQHVEDNLFALSNMLRASSPPFHSPRYAAHMCSDLLMPATLAYFATMLYNPNNVAWEASPITTSLELEAAQKMGQMLGFSKDSYGHITSGGTLANIEALWVARNVATIPFGLKEVAPELVAGLTDFQLENMPLQQMLELIFTKIEDKMIPEKIEELKKNSIRAKGLAGGQWRTGKVFVPRTKHYSWNKASDVLGIGTDNLVYVDIDSKFRMNIEDLKKKMLAAIHNKDNILMVVGVLGSTEEGSVDPLHQILKLREQLHKDHGVWFWAHVDAAYGGYSASLVLDENFKLIPRDALIERLEKDEIIHKKYKWPSQEVYDGYAAIGHFESATVDPHKLGYVPYQAGGIVICDKRVQSLVSFFATYIFQVFGSDTTSPLGSFILEGSKAGATAAAVWMAHQCVPGNIAGYGKIIGESFEGAHLLYHKLNDFGEFEVKSTNQSQSRFFKFHPLNLPDTNLLIYVLNEKGNNSLKKMNLLNEKVRDLTCPKEKKFTLSFDLLLSSTSLTEEEYGECPKPLLENIGIDSGDWDEVKTLLVLRSTFMSPYVTPDYTDVKYEENLVKGVQAVLKHLLDLSQI